MKRSLLVAVGFIALGCNLLKREQSDRPLPEPEPSSKVLPSRPPEPGATPLKPAAEAPTPSPVAAAGAPATSKPDPTTKPTPAQPTPTTSGSAAPAPTPTPAPTLTLPPVDGGLAIPTAACIQKCQGRLQQCMSKPIALDGGLPSLDSMNECKKAFEDCRGDCS